MDGNLLLDGRVALECAETGVFEGPFCAHYDRYAADRKLPPAATPFVAAAEERGGDRLRSSRQKAGVSQRSSMPSSNASTSPLVISTECRVDQRKPLWAGSMLSKALSPVS